VPQMSWHYRSLHWGTPAERKGRRVSRIYCRPDRPCFDISFLWNTSRISHPFYFRFTFRFPRLQFSHAHGFLPGRLLVSFPFKIRSFLKLGVGTIARVVDVQMRTTKCSPRAKGMWSLTTLKRCHASVCECGGSDGRDGGILILQNTCKLDAES
jgi:hypothetical protein